MGIPVDQEYKSEILFHYRWLCEGKASMHVHEYSGVDDDQIATIRPKTGSVSFI